MHVLDIDKFRNQQIQFNGLAKADVVYTFYHDETNNTKKLRVTAEGFNIAKLDVFALGGVVHEGAPRAIDIWPLREAMRIQKSAPEIKLTHVAKGSFLDLLQSERLTVFLRWIADSGLMVHYHSLDPLYWSIVDILDSILARLDNPMLVAYGALLKSDLALVLRADLSATTKLFYRYNYPNLDAADRQPFLNALIELLERNESVLPEFNFMMLKGTLQAGRGLRELVFIENNQSHELIDNFSTFYMTRIALFKYSTHILDMEDSIREHFQTVPLTSGGRPVSNYRFADSKSEAGIQISDVVVGLLGKLHSYLTEREPKDVAAARSDLSGAGLTNAELLRELIDASHECNIAFLHHVASRHDIDKLDQFLRFRDGKYGEP
jgi:hypothetical protein